MKTLHKRIKLFALLVVCAMLMAAGTAVAISHDKRETQILAARLSSPELIGRFVVTPTKATFIAASRQTAKF